MSVSYLPGENCGNGVLSDWDRTRARYLGAQAHNVKGCVGQMDYYLMGYWRHGYRFCEYTWTTPNSNPMGHNYGDTWYAYWRMYNGNGSSYAHTFTGWGSNNQTD